MASPVAFAVFSCIFPQAAWSPGPLSWACMMRAFVEAAAGADGVRVQAETPGALPLAKPLLPAYWHRQAVVLFPKDFHYDLSEY